MKSDKILKQKLNLASSVYCSDEKSSLINLQNHNNNIDYVLNLGLAICGIGRAIGIGRRGLGTNQLPLPITALTRSVGAIKTQFFGNINF